MWIAVLGACLAGCALSRAGLEEMSSAEGADARPLGDATGAAGDDGAEAAGEPDASHSDAPEATTPDATATKDVASLPDADEDADQDVAPDPDAAPCQGVTESCGPPGACVDCTNDPRGTDCVGETCGCTGQSDCPLGQACSLQTNTCTTSCEDGLQCNGGCCDGMNCQSGDADDACGNDGLMCVNCAPQQCQQNQCQ